jgi:hypothetical protein
MLGGLRIGRIVHADVHSGHRFTVARIQDHPLDAALLRGQSGGEQEHRQQESHGPIMVRTDAERQASPLPATF